MIYRQDLERYKVHFNNAHLQAMSQLQHQEGQVDALKKMRASGKLLQQAKQRALAARDEALIAAGGAQLIEYLLKEVDLEEPEFHLDNPISVMQFED